MRLSRILLWGLALTVATTAITLAVMMLFVATTVDPQRVLATGIVLFVHLVVALGCAVARERGRASRLMFSGVLAASGTAGGWIALIWLEPASIEELWFRVIVWPAAWSGLMLVCGLLLLPEARRVWWLWMRRVTFALVALLALHACLAITFYPDLGAYGMSWSDIRRYEEVTMRVAGVLGLLAGMGATATLASVWMMHLVGRVPPPLRTYVFRFVCPRCGFEQSVCTGICRCQRCDLAVEVTVV